MSDTDVGLDDEQESVVAAGKTRGNRLRGATGVVRALVIVAAVLGAIIFVAVISVITVMIFNGRSAKTTLEEMSPSYQGAPTYTYTDPIQIRGRTSDPVARTFQVSVVLGYDLNDEKTAGEIAKRSSQLQDLIRRFFSQKTVDRLQPEQEIQLKNELREQINLIFNQGKVKDILFPEYLVDF